MNKTNTNWHMIFVKKGEILRVHTELQRLIKNDVGRKTPLAGCELWTPFDAVKVINPNGGRKKWRAFATFDQIMYIRLACRDQKMVINELVKRRKYIKGPFLSPVWLGLAVDWYDVPQKDMNALMSHHGPSFDPKRDARMNAKRAYGQIEVEIPDFTAGERVRFFSGPMEGIAFEVLATLDDAVKLEPVKKGWMGKVEASAFDLKRIA